MLFRSKPDNFSQNPISEVYNIFSLGLNPDASNYPGIAIYKPSNTYDLLIRAADSVNNTAVTTLQVAGMLDGGGGSQATQYIPQWHHYGFIVQKASSTSVAIRAYKDGQFITSSIRTGLTAGGNYATTYNHVLGSIRGSAGRSEEHTSELQSH